MANTEAPAPSSAYVEDLFRARYLEMVRLAGLLGADDLAIVHEDHREVIAALAALPVRRREAIVLRYWLDLPEREIAAAMGVSQGTVKSHVSRGLAALGRALPGIPAGTVTGYLVDGRVGFWSPLFEDDAAICPVPAGGQPVLDGLVTTPITSGQTGATTGVVALGYAHAGVARVVVRVPDGKLLSVSTFAAGWRGSDLRLWAVKLPKDSFNVAKGSSMAVTATAYDAAGRVMGTVQLGELGL